MNEQEPIKIIIDDEEPPLKADEGQSIPRKVAGDAGRKATAAAAVAARKAWNSETGRRAAKKLQEVSDQGIRYVGTRMADAAEDQARQTAASVQERMRNADWQEEAKVGLVAGMKWLSAQVAEIAERVNTNESQEKSPPDVDQPGGE
jgi:hypothetical protein